MIHRIALMTPLVFSVLTAHGDPNDQPPRGADIHEQAHMCGAGPIGKLGKAGSYNTLCPTLTEAEKCLALIKSRFTPEHHLDKVNTDEEKIMTEFCLEQFKNELLGD